MFERYTEKARRVIFFARYEAAQFGSEFIETAHLLLGLFREDPDLAYRFLGLGVAEAESKLHAIRKRIEDLTQRRPKVSTSADLPLSRESKLVLHYSAEEGERLNHEHIHPEHLLLGLLRVEGSQAERILQEQGLRLSLVREEIAKSKPAETGRTGFRFGRTGGGAYRPGAPHFAPQRGFWMSAMQDAGRVLHLARREADQRNSPCIETIDLLLAVMIEKEVSERFPALAESVRQRRNPKPDPQREKVSSFELPFTEECKFACTLATEEAAQLGQPTGPGHLLMGLLRVESCAAAQILRDCGLTEAGIRAQLRPPPPSSDPEQGRSYV
jgi:ATP-dependent Clp protease ATP-binding subunit ClpA